MSDSPAAILFDQTGHPVLVSVDGVNYRLGVESKEKSAFNATRTSVAAATSDTLLLASNANRLDVILYNDSDAQLYIGYGSSTVSITDFTIIISAHTEQVLPINFAGELRGIWASTGGFVRITEIT